MRDLVVVMPVYNEAGCVVAVLQSWLEMLDGLGIDYELRVTNDGSTDGTRAALASLAHPALRVRHQENRGHGPTLQAEYGAAVGEGVWIFQTDSDGELPASAFPACWAGREAADVWLGVREGRRGPWSRRVVTGGMCALLRGLFGVRVADPNCPYRLMRQEVVADFLKRVRPDRTAPNVLLTAFAVRSGVKVREVPVPYTPRQTGVVSIRALRLLRVVLRSSVETVSFWRSR